MSKLKRIEFIEETIKNSDGSVVEIGGFAIYNNKTKSWEIVKSKYRAWRSASVVNQGLTIPT